MNIMKSKFALSNQVHVKAKSSGLHNAEKAKAVLARSLNKEPRGIYSAARNLDSNFRC